MSFCLSLWMNFFSLFCSFISLWTQVQIEWICFWVFFPKLIFPNFSSNLTKFKNFPRNSPNSQWIQPLLIIILINLWLKKFIPMSAVFILMCQRVFLMAAWSRFISGLICMDTNLTPLTCWMCMRNYFRWSKLSGLLNQFKMYWSFDTILLPWEDCSCLFLVQLDSFINFQMMGLISRQMNLSTLVDNISATL